jgi:hypothetical protein
MWQWLDTGSGLTTESTEHQFLSFTNNYKIYNFLYNYSQSVLSFLPSSLLILSSLTSFWFSGSNNKDSWLAHRLSVYSFVANLLQNTTPNSSSTVMFVCGCWGLAMVHVHGWLLSNGRLCDNHSPPNSNILTPRHHVTLYSCILLSSRNLFLHQYP